MSDKVIHASDADFDTTVLQSSEPVLVDFWAPWCAPCKMIGPVVDQLADEYDGRAKMVKVDVQAFPNLGIRFNVRSIPMLLLFKDGQVQASQMGAPGNIKTVLNQMIERALDLNRENIKLLLEFLRVFTVHISTCGELRRQSILLVLIRLQVLPH